MIWDDVIFSNLFLHCNFETYLNLSKTCKKAKRVGKIVREQWIERNAKQILIYDYAGIRKKGFRTVTYYNGKGGKRILHGLTIFSYKNDILIYKYGKLSGECFINNRKENYKNGYLQGSVIRYNAERKPVSVRFYIKGKKCCSLKNNGDHFCLNHMMEGYQLMNS
jgi:hypothetical protein